VKSISLTEGGNAPEKKGERRETGEKLKPPLHPGGGQTLRSRSRLGKGWVELGGRRLLRRGSQLRASRWKRAGGKEVGHDAHFLNYQGKVRGEQYKERGGGGLEGHTRRSRRCTQSMDPSDRQKKGRDRGREEGAFRTRESKPPPLSKSTEPSLLTPNGDIR